MNRRSFVWQSLCSSLPFLAGASFLGRSRRSRSRNPATPISQPSAATFGVVTEFEVALHPVSKLLAGIITLESEDQRHFLRAFRDFLPTVPDELTFIALMSAEPGHKPQIDIEACYVGEPTEGEKVLAPLRNHPDVVHDTVQVRPYLELEQMTPAVIPPSYEEHCSGFFAELDEQRIELFAHAFSSAPFPVECFFVHLHGAVTQVPVAATAFPLRRTSITFDVAAGWKPPNGQRAASEWIEALKRNCPWTKTATT
jgi:hypothetical protein